MESVDSPDLSLPYGQDTLIAAIAAANRNTIVVLEVGNPVAMPWRDSVKGIVVAWFSGQQGGRAIAEILTGQVNPSGRLPITFPVDIAQTVRPQLPGFGTPPNTPTDVEISEGADVGYRWFSKKGLKPLYAFGYGLSYTTFILQGLTLTGGETVTAQFRVQNTGSRPGADIPQLYLDSINGIVTPRLLGFERVELQPGESQLLSMTVDPRLLANFDTNKQQWRIEAGSYSVSLACAADAPVETSQIMLLAARHFGH